MDDHAKQSIFILTISGMIICGVWFLLSRWDGVALYFGNIWRALTPFLFGIVITFVVFPLRNIVENKWLGKRKWNPRTKRKVAVTVSMIVFGLIVASFFIVLTPQLSDSMSTLLSNMDGYMTTLQNMVTHVTENSEYAPVVNALYDNFRSMITQFISGTAGFVTMLVTYSVSLIRGIFNFFVGIIIAIYFLLDSEKFIQQMTAVNYSLFSKRTADRFVGIVDLTVQMMNRFVFGKLLDSLIIGIFCYLMTELLTIPYAPLISFIVGITNMIPVFGPFIGAVPSIFILLIIQPSKAVEFAIFILVLQQIDGNIIGPYILGDSMGLPPIWIMFAIIVGGSVAGVVGMFLGVPIFSVLYILITRYIKQNLKAKNIVVKEKNPEDPS